MASIQYLFNPISKDTCLSTPGNMLLSDLNYIQPNISTGQEAADNCSFGKALDLWVCCVFSIVAISLQVTNFSSRSRILLQELANIELLRIYTSILVALLSLVQIAWIGNSQFCASRKHQNDDIVKMDKDVVFGVVVAMTTLHKKLKIFRGYFLFLVVWSAMLISAWRPFNTLWEMSVYSTNNIEFTLDLIRCLGVFFTFVLLWIPEIPASESKRSPFNVTEHSADNPEDKASWLSSFTLCWADSIIWTGYKRHLKEKDVPKLASRDRCCNVLPQFERMWKETMLPGDVQRDGSETGPFGKSGQFFKDAKDSESANRGNRIISKNSLTKVLLKSFGLQFFTLQLVKTFLEMEVFVDSIFTAMLMNHIQNREKESLWNGTYIVISMFVFKCAVNMTQQRLWFSIGRVSRHIRTSLIMALYKKSMSLNNECKKDKTNGEMVNLIADDSYQIQDVSERLFLIVLNPLKILTALCMLYIYLGWSMVFGMAIMILLIPLNNYSGRLILNAVNQRTSVRDKRVKLMNEIINGIKVIKLYAWEKSFIDKVTGIRSKELDILKTRCLLEAYIESMVRAIPLLVTASAFGTFLLLGGHLDPTIAFVAIGLFRNLSQPLQSMAKFIPHFTDAFVALRRISDFLDGADISDDIVTKVSEGQSAISINDGDFTWERTNSRPTLKNISVEIPKGRLVAVVGLVGSGKSSLLSAILGEMDKVRGCVKIQGNIAYVPQEAWILNDTFLANILFGSSLNNDWYRQVIHSCSLESDVSKMAAGHRSEIGEKGINLSGGQKQRISLARAVYSDADVLLFDDPLSAVDAHVGKHIFKNVVGNQGILKGKTRILVTHGIQWLPYVDSIIVMKDGQVSESGSYEQLISNNGAFAQFLLDTCSKSSESDDYEVKRLKQSVYKRLNSMDCQSKDKNVKDEYCCRKEDHKNLNDSQLEDMQTLNETVGFENASDEMENDSDSNATQPSGKIIFEEETQRGSISSSTLFEYIRAIGFKSVFLFIIIFCVTIIADNYKMHVFKRWSEIPVSRNLSIPQSEDYFKESWHHFNSYVFCGVIEIVSAFFFIILTMKGAYNATSRIHNRLLETIMKCPMSFFEANPSSRVVSRFSADLTNIDGLQHCLKGFIGRFFILITCMLLIVINSPTILLCLIPVTGIYYALYRIHVSSMRQLRRYNNNNRSYMFSHSSETLSGVSSIRAYNCQERFVRIMVSKVEMWNKFETMEKALEAWFGMRMIFLFTIIQMVTGIFVVMDTTMTAGMAGLIFMYAREFSYSLDGLFVVMTRLETDSIVLERVLEYAKKPSEAPWEMPENKLASDWPVKGHIVLNNLQARYRNGQDLILKGINFEIMNGEKIGIVGRTGAGKSSITMALFRLIEAAGGHIKVDNEIIANIGLHDLRNKITILPQEPVIFAGTLRMNLDPFNKSTTEELWEVLEHSHLKLFVEGLPDQLDFVVEEGGKNLSVGQRQLLCLARSLLRHTKILVLDEATAAVDMETDELIQKTIRKEFNKCTVLAIAHRLNTIMDYDRILVLDQGLVKEFDSPNNLLADKQSMFYSLARDARLVP